MLQQWRLVQFDYVVEKMGRGISTSEDIRNIVVTHSKGMIGKTGFQICVPFGTLILSCSKVNRTVSVNYIVIIGQI